MKLPPFPKWKSPRGGKRPPNDAELTELNLAREAWAEAQIVGWDKRGLQTDDHVFCSWCSADDRAPTGIESGHFGLRLGVLYEYARECHKLRGLLLLADPSRKLEQWEFGPPKFQG